MPPVCLWRRSGTEVLAHRLGVPEVVVRLEMKLPKMSSWAVSPYLAKLKRPGARAAEPQGGAQVKERQTGSAFAASTSGLTGCHRTGGKLRVPCASQ